MTYISNTSKPDLSDHYLVFLSGVLLGYAIIGKGFAYLGLPPLFIGEIAFITGFVILLRTGCLIAALTTLPSLVLAAAMAWVLLRTLPFVGAYGFDALRDSVVIMYGGFAFIVIALLLEDGRRVNTIVRYYGGFLKLYVPTIPFLFAFNRYMLDYIPVWPGYNVPLLRLGPGEVAVHLAGAAVFALVGFCKATPLWIALVFTAVLLASTESRGAMLAFGLPVIFAAIMHGNVRETAIVLVAGMVIFSAAYAVETAFTDYREATSSLERSVSTRQIVDNAMSIVGSGGEQTEATKAWRTEWWDLIFKNTLYGPHFWTGRGFGLNLADADGFAVGKNKPVLRSPHNAHMTLLARAGVPGLALWLLLLASWFAMLTNAVLTARRRGHTRWAGLFLFIDCYVMAIIINATFDVALEGPMQGIWFWCLFGFGIGSEMVYRAVHERR
jgi:O-Antigen ligase